MIDWYADDEVGIFFDKVPNVQMRYPTPWDDREKYLEINKKPFICNSELDVELKDKKKGKVYRFKIPQGYTYDGASIPRMFWRFIGAKTDPRFLIPSMVHDILCENHDYVDNDRYFADRVFERLLYVSKVSAFNRWMIFHSVDNFQKFCGWSK